MSEQTSDQDPLTDLSKLISVTEASEMSGLTTGYIRRLLRNNVIVGKKIGRDWFTTEETIREYLAIERRPGPKPKQK